MLSLLSKPFSSSSSSLRTLSLHRLHRTLTYVADEKRFDDGLETKSSFIHPTAIVHPGAVIGQGVSIGPFCTVGSSAKLGSSCQLHPASHVFGDTELGERCIVMTGAIVGEDIPGRTVIGCNNIIGHHSVVGVKCQDMKYKPGDECFLDVGDNNEIREYTSIHRSSKSSERTVIGHNNLIMGSCHIAHDCKVGNNNILANNTLLAGHIVVEDYAHTAGAIVVHQFCHVGSFSFVGGGSVVSQDVPKYMMVAGDRAELRGLNLEGLRRRGFSIEELNRCHTSFYTAMYRLSFGVFSWIDFALHRQFYIWSAICWDAGIGGRQTTFHLVARFYGTSFLILLFGLCGRSAITTFLKKKLPQSRE